MENAAEALKMAAAVLIFVLALSICIASFSQARVASQTLLERTDKDYYTSFMTGSNPELVVGLETIIPTIYKAYYENYKIVFSTDGAPTEFVQNGLYKQNDGNGNMKPVYEIDLEEQHMGTRTELFIAAILYGKSYFNSTTKYDGKSYHSETEGEYGEDISKALDTYANDEDGSMVLSDKGLYDIIKTGNYTFKQYIGEYYQNEVANIEHNSGYNSSSDANQVSGANTPDANKVTKRVITYVFN